MSQTLIGRSSVHHLIDALKPRWGSIGDTPVALNIAAPPAEEHVAAKLALCDLSALAKTGVKGPQAATWLAAQQLDVPQQTYDVTALPDGGVMTKISSNEFVLESGIANQTVSAIKAALGSVQDGAYHTEQQMATFFLSGVCAGEVLSQTCGVEFEQVVNGRLLYSRIAGVSAAILPDTVNDLPVYRLWIGYNFGPALWQTLSQIAGELGGQVVGALCFYPQLDNLQKDI
jgi:sarcosine oxidase subunit gamma